MDGIHDLGGMHGFGPVHRAPHDPVFQERWEGRVFAMVVLLTGAGVYTPDSFRFGIESLPPSDYLASGYYGRWLASLESNAVSAGVTTPAELSGRARALESGQVPAGSAPYAAPAAGTFRVDARREDGDPAFAVGDPVCARTMSPPGHTRLPRYARGKRGVIESLGGVWVFPDRNATGAPGPARAREERPEHVYCVRFEGCELWGPDAEPSTRVFLDLFEPYLEPA